MNIPTTDSIVSIKRAVLAAVAIAVTQASDLITTVLGLDRGARELNPLIRTAFESYGVAGIAGIKVIAGAIIIASTWRRRYSPWVISALFGAVSVSNILQMSKLVL